MAGTYEIHLHDPVGQRLMVLPAYREFEAIRSVNTIGTLRLVVPYGLIPERWLSDDYILVLWRSGPGGGARVNHTETLYYIQRVRHADKNGDIATTIECVDANERLRRRIIAYYAGSSQTAKSATPADNIMKALVRENLASTASDYASSTVRGLPASGFTVQSNLSLGATTSKACAWRNLYDVLRELADDSRSRGTWLAFDMVVKPGLGQEFRTYIGQRGVDRRSGQNAITLSQEAGTLANVELTLDYSQMATTVYAGGRGEEATRIIQTASDTSRVRTTGGRREVFTTAYQGETAAYVLSEAQADLSGRRPRVGFVGEVRESGYLEYGRNLGFGDYVKAEGYGRTVNARLDTVITRSSDSGAEQIEIILRSETLL